MGQENATLNTAGESSTPAQDGGLISTIEFVTSKSAADTEPEGANNTEGATTDGPDKGKEAAGEAGKTGDKEKLDGQEDRFDKHPRFQELRTKLDASEKRYQKLEAQLSALKESQAKPSKDAENLPFKDTSKMSDEELLDWQSEDPRGYRDNLLAQAKHELRQEMNQTLESRSSEDAIVHEYQTFAERHPDFDPMWEDGTIPEFMDAHPGHNAISAYLILSQEKMVQEAVTKAVSEAEKKFASNQRAKRENVSLGAGPQTTGTPGSTVDAALQNSSKFGGTTRVLADRLRARRQAQAG